MSRIGTMIGQYRILRELGRGGMGVVYEAEHVVLHQHAAIKMLVGVTADDAEFIQRFEAEARAACAAQHAGLVKVFDFGRGPDGAPFLVMEYIQGDTLRAGLTAGVKFSTERTRRIGYQIATALAAIHARDIIHRDLKPENVMLVADDGVDGHERIKLLDFGIARRGVHAANTQPGVIVGTPAYMSPEQCTTGPVGPASDVYAAGVVLYEMLTGAPPFTGESTHVLVQHVSAEVPAAALAEVPADLRDVVLAALAKEPTRRPTAQTMADRLLRRSTASLAPVLGPALAPTARIPLHSATVTRRKRPVRLASAIGVAIAAAVLIAAIGRKDSGVGLIGTVRIAGGTFTMGRTAQELLAECGYLGAECRTDVLDREQPARQVRVSPFFLDIYEVTNEEFAKWLNIDPAQLRVEDDGPKRPNMYVKDRHGALLLDLQPEFLGIELDPAPPRHFRVRDGYAHKAVVQVSWDAANQFCEARGKRLPTEAEWEFAARRDTPRRYPWGDQEPGCDGVILGRGSGLPCAAFPRGPADVGTSRQDWTSDHVADLAGNVSEWVFDAFTLPYYPDCGSCVDPKVDHAAPAGHAAGEDFRVYRGGAWASTIFARTSARGRWNRNTVSTDIGFRCAAKAP